MRELSHARIGRDDVIEVIRQRIARLTASRAAVPGAAAIGRDDSSHCEQSPGG
jgi:hypothetical protein